MRHAERHGNLWQRALAAGLLLLAAAAASASGPRFITGPPYFTGYQSVPIGWKQPTLLYYTDPGSLSASVPHAAADALVAAAAGLWNVPVASITVQQGGPLAEHVSGQNVYLDANGMEYPADVMSANAAAIPVAVIYDTDGSVTDTLLGAGASLPASCNANAVTSTVDRFDPAGYILHAIVILNGRCTGPAAAQQMQMQYKLERAFGRVLGLAWSQNNDNVFTGSPTPTYNQAMHWPIMHPIDILCGPYSYQCLPSPFTLRPDDVASLVSLYPNAANATPAAGKQASQASASGIYGTITFPSGQGMAGVNIVVQRQGSNLPLEAWNEVSAVTGYQFRQAAVSPFVSAGTSPTASMGTTFQNYQGTYQISYVPIDAGAELHQSAGLDRGLEPLYTGLYGLVPYGLNAVAPSGSAPAPQSVLGVYSGQPVGVSFTVADAASTCGTGLDGTAAEPAQMAATGWWTGTLCGYGHAAYLGVDVKPGRSFTVEATALDPNGLATTTKAMPVIGLFAPSDAPGSLPSVGVAPAAFQGLSYGTTVLPGLTGNLSRLIVGVADERGDGRPDYAYQGRMFYADNVEPAQVATAGGTVTISGLGFRAGNGVLVNGVPATVTKWSAGTLLVTVPAAGAAHASSGAAVDVEVFDRGTGATSTISSALTYSAAGPLPNAMILVAAPEGTLPVGVQAATPLTVRVVAADGVTPVVGDRIIFSATAGQASFAVCGAASCAVTTDANGTATTMLTPLAAGAITLQAADGILLEQAGFIAFDQPSSMKVLLAPTGAVPVGTTPNTPFAVQVYAPDGQTTLPNQVVQFSVAAGSAVYTACNAAVCSVTTNGQGIAYLYATPAAAGTVTLQAAIGTLSMQASFTATQDIDTMSVYSAPAASAYVGEGNGLFLVRLLRGDGVTGDYGEMVTFHLSPGTQLTNCPGQTCQLYTNSQGYAGGNTAANVAGTFTIQASYGALSQTVTFSTKARSLSLNVLSAPSGKIPIGTVATTPFTVQLLALDGVTPLAGVPLTIEAPSNQVILSACNFGTCALTTDGQGMVSTRVTPLVAGTIPIDAVYSPLIASASITGVAAADSLTVLTQPGGATLHPGDPAGFRVQLLEPDGSTPDAGQTVTFTVTQGNFTFPGCAKAACSAVTDAQGVASLSGVAGAAGPVVVSASFGNLAQAMSFTISPAPHVLQVVSSPASGAYVGTAAALPFSVRVLQADGTTAVAQENVTFSVTNGSAAQAACNGASMCTLQTDASGTVSSAVTPQVAGSITLLAVDGTVSQSATFTAADRPDTLQLLSAPAAGAYVGKVAGTPFAVQVMLGNGTPAGSGKNVTVSVTNGSAGLGACAGASSCTLSSDAGGRVSTTVTPMAAGTITLTVTDGGASVTASFTANNQPDILQLVSAPADGALVGDAASAPFTIRVLAADGVTPVAGRTLGFTVSGGSATFGACAQSICTLTSDANGLVSSPATPLAAGAVTLLATDGTVTQSASFTAAAKPDTLRVVSAPASGAFVGALASPVFSIQVLHGDGAPAAGITVTLTVTNGSAAFAACNGASSCVLVTDASGTVSSGVTPLAAGSITLSAADGAVTQSVSFTAVSRPDVLQLISVPADGSLVGDVAAASFSVKVLAGDGVTPVPGRTVTLSVTGGSARLSACGAATCMVLTDANGVAGSGVTPLAPGAITLLAADGNVTQAASFTALARPDVLSIVSAPQNGAWVGVAAAQAFTARLTLADGVTADAGKAVVLSGNNVDLAVCGAAMCSLVTDANGLVTTPVTPLAPGSITLSATAGALTQSVSFTAANRPDTITVQTLPADGSAVGNVAAVPFAVQVLAGDGSSGAGRSVTLTVTNGTLTACGAATCVLMADAQGVVRSGVVPQSAGTVGLLASDGSVSASASFTAVARPDVLTVVSVPANGSLAGDVAAVPFAVRVTAGDGSVAAGESVTVNVTNAVLVACGAASCMLTSDAKGMVSTGVSPQSAGMVSLTAIDGSVAVSASFTAAAKPDVLTVVSVPPDGSLAGEVAAVPFAVRVTAGDGSEAAGRSVTVSVTNAVLAACSAASCALTSDAQGMVSTGITPASAGTVNLSASDAAISVAASFTAASRPDVIVLNARPPAEANVGDAVAATLRVLLADGVTPAAGRTVIFTQAGASVLLGGCQGSPCSAVTDAGGTIAVTLTAVAEGTVTVVASEPAGGSNTVELSFTAKARPDSMVLVSAPAGSGLAGDAMPVAFAVRVLEGDGVTPAAGRSVAFTVSAGSASFGACGASVCTLQTDANGVASTSVTPQAAGSVTVAAAEANNSLSATFSATPRPDLLQLSSMPGATVHMGTTAAAPFAVKLVQADGITPVAGVDVTFSSTGRGAGAVQFGACGTASCVVSTDASGLATTPVMGTGVGAVTLLATADPATGAGSVSLAFQVVANDDSLNALEAVTYVAEGAVVHAKLEASANSNGTAAAGIAVVWAGAPGVMLEQVQATTGADGTASAEVALGPLAAGATAQPTACAWNGICAGFAIVGTAQAQLQVALTSGGQQDVTGGAAPAPVTAWVSDGAGAFDRGCGGDGVPDRDGAHARLPCPRDAVRPRLCWPRR